MLLVLLIIPLIHGYYEEPRPLQPAPPPMIKCGRGLVPVKKPEGWLCKPKPPGGRNKNKWKKQQQQQNHFDVEEIFPKRKQQTTTERAGGFDWETFEFGRVRR